ncbi:hypothetical protein ACFL5G_03975 [Candidatus Margulisiibacteriota bacterium]
MRKILILILILTIILSTGCGQTTKETIELDVFDPGGPYDPILPANYPNDFSTVLIYKDLVLTWQNNPTVVLKENIIAIKAPSANDFVEYNAAQESTYRLQDVEPGIYSYYVKEVDINGVTSNSNIGSIEIYTNNSTYNHEETVTTTRVTPLCQFFIFQGLFFDLQYAQTVEVRCYTDITDYAAMNASNTVIDTTLDETAHDFVDLGGQTYESKMIYMEKGTRYISLNTLNITPDPAYSAGSATAKVRLEVIAQRMYIRQL